MFVKHAFPPNILRAMMRRKPLYQHDHHDNDHDHDNEASLHRTLTAVDLMLYGVGCSVGAGIYCLVGIGAQLAGPAISLSFLTCGTACIFTSLAYAEFAARLPITGSAYVYASVAFGEYCGWLVGWFLTLGYGFTASVVARSWADYVAAFLQGILQSITTLDHISLAYYLTRFPIYGTNTSYTCSPLSIVIVALCTWVLVSGAKESSRFNNIMTMFNISVLLFVVVTGIWFVSAENLIPFAPHGMEGVAQGAGLVFFAFIGFDMVACLSEEVVHPERNMPIGIVGSLVISATIYVVVSLVVIGMAPIDLLGDKVHIVNALLANACCTHDEQVQADAALVCLHSSACTPPSLHKILAYGGHIVSFGAIFGLTTGTFTSLMGQPRILYRMAQDGLLFGVFGIVNPTTRVPTGGILITGIVASLLACFVELESLANMISLGTLMVFTFVDAGVLILRWSPSFPLVDDACRDDDDDDDDNVDVEVTTSSGPTTTPTTNGTHKNHNNNKVLAWCQGHDDVTDNGVIKPVLGILLFTVSLLVASVTISTRHVFFFVVSTGMAIACTLYLWFLPQSPPPATFSCPCVPLVPLIGIASNAIMMASLPRAAWIFTTTWFCMGNAVYFVYGIRHSRLGKQQQQQQQVIRMLSLPETEPLTRQQEELQLESYQSTEKSGLEHRLHPT